MIDVILPVLDERDALPGVLDTLPDGFAPIVVDNGSTDGSADVACAYGARVVCEPQRGFGAACWTGLCAAEARVVCFMDCDGSFDSRDLERVAAPVQRGEADLALGARVAVERGAWPYHARVGNHVLANYIRRRTGIPLRDLGPMRAAERSALLTLGMRDRRFGWPLEMVLRAAAAQWRITELDVAYLPRTGRSKVTGTVRGTVRTVADMRRISRELTAIAR
jgi:glycosyltransferase involved in cell wall biosynthesis